MRIAFCVFNYNFDRLDTFISETFNLSRRKVKVLFSENRILLNKKRARKGDKVSFKNLIEIDFKDEKFDYSEIKILNETDDFLIIYKPAEIHSEEIFKNKKSVENFLKQNFNENVKLLNRLDFNAQGLLIASKNNDFYEKYKSLENEKKIEKFYLTFVEGKIFKKFTINAQIDQNKRKIVKVLNKKSESTITEVTPFAIYSNFSIITVKIFKGARHQIRAHLAYSNNPLIGDKLYGSNYLNFLKFFLFCYGYKCNELNLNFFEFSILKKRAKEYLMEFLGI